jgi:hypothetical protein
MRIVRIVRNVEFIQLFDTFLITAITTILVIRFYLKITGYPQFGGFLHISHLLPGTLMMLAAILILLAAVNRSARGFAAFLAGLGFGFCWDELGKFITKNNNYFFHATPGLIYITFIALYLLVRYFGQRRFTQNDYIANVLDLLKDAAINDLDRHEYEHAKQLMAHVSPNHHLYDQTLQLLKSVKPTAVRRPSVADKALHLIKLPLIKLSRQEYFPSLVIGIALAYGAVSLLMAMFFFAGATLPDTHHVAAFFQGDESDLIGGISALISAIFVSIGAYWYFNDRVKRSYKFFEQGLLVNIFIGQIVLFFKSQQIALLWLAITLLLLISLELLASEKAMKPAATKNT